MYIGLFTAEDAKETAKMIADTMKVSNNRNYSREFIENNIDAHSAAVHAEVSKERHIYVACDGERIIGTVGIAGYWGSLTESIC